VAKSFGPKADNLIQLDQAGFYVPKFYVLPAALNKELGSSKTTERLKREFTEWINKNEVSSVAVRSSSTQEDNQESSFAGQFTTLLDIKDPDEFIIALKTVFQSKQSKAYSKKTGEINIIVQEFIEPDISGVMFSINPANGNNEFVINAAEGRGTNVVEGGQAEQYFVSRLNTRKYHLEGNAKSMGILSTENIENLAANILKTETLFAYPQDIEWAIKDSVLYMLQARPVTRINHLKVWDSSNIAESFPGIVLPLTFSIARKGYLLGYKAQAYSGGMSWYELEAHHREFDSMVGIFNGKMYYNLLNWYKIISLFPGSQRNQKFLDDQIATQGGAVYQLPIDHSFGFKIKYIFRIFYRAIFFRSELNDFYTRYAKFESEMSSMPAYGDSQVLMQQYAHIEQTIIPHFGRTLDNDFLVMTYHGLLKRFLNKWLPNHPFETTNIIGSMSGVMSAQQALSLYQLADRFKADPRALELLQEGKYETLDTYLEASRLEAEVNEYIEVFGHRFAEDQKIEIINPTLEPNGIYKLIQPYIRLDSKSIRKRLAESTKATNALEQTTTNQLKFGQKIMYKFVLKRLKNHLRLREKNRLMRGKTYGYLRELFPKVGQALVNEGVIEQKNDVYYLLIEEIYELMQGTLISNDLRSRITKRRESYEEYKKIEMPERFITKSLPSLERIEAITQLKNKSRIKSSMEGLISSPGTVEGRVVVLTEPKIPDEPYDILVARHTDPGWTPLIALAKGVIVEYGGMLSHAAIVTRELGIPSIIGVEDVTKILKTGMHVRINTQLSCVEILDKS
jgi:rifampicin phosphotransferase